MALINCSTSYPKLTCPSAKVFDNEALFQLHKADAGLRWQAAIAKCKAMGRPDPYQERARAAKLTSTPMAESIG